MLICLPPLRLRNASPLIRPPPLSSRTGTIRSCQRVALRRSVAHFDTLRLNGVDTRTCTWRPLLKHTKAIAAEGLSRLLIPDPRPHPLPTSPLPLTLLSPSMPPSLIRQRGCLVQTPRNGRTRAQRISGLIRCSSCTVRRTCTYTTLQVFIREARLVEHKHKHTPFVARPLRPPPNPSSLIFFFFFSFFFLRFFGLSSPSGSRGRQHWRRGRPRAG